MNELEEKTRKRLSEATGHRCIKGNEVGISGNVWEIDCILIGPGEVRLAYAEIKDTWNDANQSTYINHMRRAYARMGDFRHKNIPKAVIVGDRREFGHKDWIALFESIDCSLLAYEELNRFIERIG
jgi:hypothetical protein